MIPLEIYLIIHNFMLFYALHSSSLLIEIDLSWNLFVRKFNMNENGNFYFHAEKVEN